VTTVFTGLFGRGVITVGNISNEVGSVKNVSSQFFVFL